MICPNCGSQNIHVTETYPADPEHIFRRRKCKDCGERFKTAELIMADNDPLRYKLYKADLVRHPRRANGGAR